MFRLIGKWTLRAALVIVCGVVVAAILVFSYDYHHSRWMPSAPWWALLAYTTLIFWSVIREFRPGWSHPTFWLSTAGLLVAHVLGYSFVLRSVSQWRPIWFLPLSFVEFAALIAILDRLGFDSSPRTLVKEPRARKADVTRAPQPLAMGSSVPWDVESGVMNAKPEFPITVRFEEDGEEWVLDTIHEIAGSLEWFDSDDPEERATVIDRRGRSVRLKVVQLDVHVLELVPPS